MQDNIAFWNTSDKLKSASFLSNLNISTPKPWPTCGFPVILKPSSKSGSECVFRANTNDQLQKAIEKILRVDEKIVIQEFIEGLALSLEVIANKGEAEPLQITGLEFDETYGCKRVYTPIEIKADLVETFNEIGRNIAEGLMLNGLTDVQAILNDKGIIKVNEVNARLPSQTPTVVYHSLGINMIKLLTKLFLENTLPDIRIQPNSAVIYQHVKILDGELRVQGEHVMSEAGELQILENFCGANEAITNLMKGKSHTGGVATLIVKTKCLKGVKKKMETVVQRIMDEYELDKYSDPYPNKEGK